MLCIFDLDGTIIRSYMERADRDFAAVELLPGRRERIAALVAEGHQVAAVSNQGGVAFGYNNEDDVRSKLQAVGAALGFPSVTIGAWHCVLHEWSTQCQVPITQRTLPIFVCYSDPRTKNAHYNQPADCARRKPGGAMIREAIEDAQIDYYNAETDEFADVPALFIGDRPEDEAAARDAGVPFDWANRFFGE